MAHRLIMDEVRTAAPLSIRRVVMRIVLAALLPMGLFAGLLFFLLWQNQQAQRNQEQIARVRTMAALIESELENVVGRLQILASDPSLNTKTLRAFDQRCRKLLAENGDWENILLLSPEKQLVNAAVPFGTPLPLRRPSDYQDKAFATMKPMVSDIFFSRLRETDTVAVAVPVIRQGKAVYVLLVGLNLESLSEALRKMIPANSVASVFDRNMRFVARSQNLESVRGQPASQEVSRALHSAADGVTRTTTREGVKVITTWTNLSNGWWIVTGTPSAAADRALAQYGGLLAVGWLIMLVAGFVLARRFVRRIDHGVALTIAVANELAAGKTARFPHANLREMDSLADAITTLFERERKARAESDDANKAKDEFLAMLGHELRNPVGAISNAVHIMDGAKRAPTDDLMARRVIVRQTGVLKRLIDDLLDIGRALTGKIALDLQTLDMSDSVRRALEALAAAGKTARHRIEIEAGPVWIRGDATRIEQVLSNLIVNAINHTPADGRIRITLTQTAGNAVLQISDTGVGIVAEALPRVFDLFYQDIRGSDRSDRARGGLGIGLTLARRLVDLHGGTIAVSSEGAGKGATFTVQIPVCAAPAPAALPAAASLPSRQTRKVLIVEDNMDARETLRAALELEGHEIRTVPDGPAAMLELKRFAADAAIVDIGLPGMDGYAVARAIRAQAGSSVQLIALTGYGLPEDREKARAAGFDAHLVKPADFAQLTALLEVPARRAG